MSDMNLTELQQKELASAEEQAGLMQAMLQNAPSQALGAMAKSLATEIQERKEAEQDPMDTLSRQGKRGSSLQREEPSRGSGKGNPSKWPRGESKGALAVAGPEAATGRTRAKRTTRRSGTRIGKRRRRTPGIRSRGCKPSPIASSGSYAG